MIYKRPCLRIGLLLGIVLIVAPVWAGNDGWSYNVREYGAVGNGSHLDTEAIQRAVDDCAITGGRVLLPPGRYLSGTIVLKSRVTVEITEGATLLGSTDIEDYPPMIAKIRYYGDSWVQYSLIYAEDCECVAITGRGTIDGQGSAFQVNTKKRPDRYMYRPYGIRFIRCRNVQVRDVTMRNSAMWMQHYLQCDDVTIRGIHVYNHCNQNNDMMDIDGCRDVVIADCIGDTDDDALTLKSSSDRMTENVTVNNCVLSSHCNAIKCGTESHAGFKNITISNCVVKPSSHPTRIYGAPKGIAGIMLTIVDGGIMEDVTVHNIRIQGPRVPLSIRLGDRARAWKEGMDRPGIGTVRNITLSNIIADGADTLGCAITGLPGHPVENVTLSNIRILFPGGGSREDGRKEVEELPEDYPESTMFGRLPAYGFYIRHARGIDLNLIDLCLEGADHRPALICDDVHGMEISGFRAGGSLHADSFLRFVASSDVLITGSRAMSEINHFLSVSGKTADQIRLTSNDMSMAHEVILLEDSAEMKAVSLKGNIR